MEIKKEAQQNFQQDDGTATSGNAGPQAFGFGHVGKLLRLTGPGRQLIDAPNVSGSATAIHFFMITGPLLLTNAQLARTNGVGHF